MAASLVLGLSKRHEISYIVPKPDKNSLPWKKAAVNFLS